MVANKITRTIPANLGDCLGWDLFLNVLENFVWKLNKSNLPKSNLALNYYINIWLNNLPKNKSPYND